MSETEASVVIDAADVKQATLAGFGVSLAEKIKHSIAIIETYQPTGEYHGCFSGGKDSVVIKELTRWAQSRESWHYNVTTIDPPEVHQFIRREHPDVTWYYPEHHFFYMLAEKCGYPLRQTRWCCQVFKESGSIGQVKMTGIRAAESPRRKKAWGEFTRFKTKGEGPATWMCNPIIHWTNADVWEFIRLYNLPYCKLYDEGWKRLGCIGCPMGGAVQVRREFIRWPQYERAWRRSFHRLWERRRGDVLTRGKRKGQQWPGFPTITTADELFEWWVSGDSCPDKNDGDNCQMGFF